MGNYSKKNILVSYENRVLISTLNQLGISGYEFVLKMSRKEWFLYFKTEKVRLFVSFQSMKFLHSRLRAGMFESYTDIAELKKEMTKFVEQKKEERKQVIRQRIISLKGEIEKLEHKLSSIS